ncbi:hypothetical protein BDN72DRAFT_880966 [Pluteus cervinus]|uniref:Uncharacterized protein n=1 Tax=Pluteus cervinus TaxID=181527 RepID=A0ACD3AKJ7_9AGAR|nr:hypothetical protein BDN72DRAFT_880966 [Pluteus cervinus]
MSISYALAIADAIRDKIANAGADPQNVATTPQDILDGRAAQQKTHTKPASLKSIRASLLAGRDVIPTSVASDAQKVIDGMSANSMKSSKDSLVDMAKAVEPIVTKFDSILTQPYLDQYSATLNTVPVVGIKNDQLLYIQTTSQLGGLVDGWATFSSLPPKRDFCLSIGKTVWKKAHLGDKDPAINWPALYSQDWTALDRTELDFQLVTLAIDGTLSYLTSDQLTPQGSWATLAYKAKSGGPATSPKFTKIAYWNNTIVGIDDASSTWSITVDWVNATYSATDSFKIEPVTEYTATDAGPVGLRSDGYLWKRIVAPSPSNDSSKDPVLEWQKWIKTDGVVNIGVASPGVILDMNVLTRSLKSRCLDVQSAVYPVVEKINAYCITHEFFLDALLQDANDYINATTDEQRALAIKNAKSFIAHAKTWGGIVLKAIISCQGPVTIMTSQLHNVRMQLESQLILLKDKLKMLQATLDVQQEAMSELKAAFWGTVAAMFLGLALMVVGALLANPWIIAAGRLLMIGGIVATVVLASKIGDLAADISNTQSQIDAVTTAISEMTNIVNAFSDLDTLYGNLNVFWGRLSNDASNVGTMDDVTCELVGYEILEDTSSMEAALSVTTEMGDACQLYLDILNRQGVVIPDSLSLTETVSQFTTSAATVPNGLQAVPTANATSSLAPVFALAQDALRSRDLDKYQQIMDFATLLDYNNTASVALAKSTTGLWFDTPALNASSDVWLWSSTSFLNASGIYDARSLSQGETTALIGSANDLDSVLNQIRPDIVGSLQDITSMASTIVDWIQQYPQAPTNADDIAKLQQLQASAVKSCESAQRKAASANNAFADFNHKATEYQQGLESQINGKNNDIKAANDRCNWDLDSLSPPWIKGERDSAVGNLNNQIKDLKNLQSSGSYFKGHVLTWIEFSQAISSNLGTVHNLLIGVWGQLYEDPVLYASLIQGEWAQLSQNAQDVFAILNNTTGGGKLELWSVSQDVVLATAAGLAPPTDSQRVIQAVTPAVNLGDDILAQSDSATASLPTSTLRNEYVNMIALEYGAVLRLQSLALLQDFRAGNVAAGKLSVQAFVQSTLVSVKSALEVTQKANDIFKDSSQKFTAVLSAIDANIASIEQQIADLTDQIDTLEDQVRDKIIWVIADTIALAFAGAALLVSFGLLATATATAAAIKTVLDSLSLSDLIKVVQSLKSTKDMLGQSVDQLKTAQPLFKSVVTAVVGLNDVISGMETGLSLLLQEVELGSNITFTQEDAEGVQAAWAKVRDDTQTWLDTINRQGIVPEIA